MKHCLSSLLMILGLVILSYSRPTFSTLNEKYERCNEGFVCGVIGNIAYPFYDGDTRPEYCGRSGFHVKCLADNISTPEIQVSGQSYILQRIDYVGHIISVRNNDNWDDNGCPLSNMVNSSAGTTPLLDFTDSDQNVNFYYGCKADVRSSSFPSIRTNCSGSGSWENGYYLTQAMLEHSSQEYLLGICMGFVSIPILKTGADFINTIPKIDTVRQALIAGFELEFIFPELALCDTCTKSGGICGQDLLTSNFVCYCPHQDHQFSCPKPVDGHQKIWAIIKVVLIVMAMGIFANVVFARMFYRSFKGWRIQRHYNRAFGPKRYSYSSIKRMTNSFKEKLGEGGFGPVYKGKIEDGILVAVKLWKQSSGDGQEFLNEVASISRTNHANIVALLGYCFEGRKQALVYEFMSNGSLEKFVHDNKNKDINRSLPTQTLFQIGVGVARGLEYLHVRCDTRILHFDIKPHNILLDEQFNPKISDFGMARSCTRRKSTISMSAARGTAGYIAPEVFFRNYGGVSYKSDVYSYGMMLLEILGQRKNENVGIVEHSSSELYFPQWIYTRLEQDPEETNFDRETLSDEEEDNQYLERKMILVGLWCIQTSPLNRPSMSSVVQMLQGKLESLRIPPMPSLSSLPRQPLKKQQTNQYCSTEVSLSLTL